MSKTPQQIIPQPQPRILEPQRIYKRPQQIILQPQLRILEPQRMSKRPQGMIPQPRQERKTRKSQAEFTPKKRGF